MVYVFRIVSPGSDLDGETKDFQDTSYAAASQRAYRWLTETFALASEDRQNATFLAFVGEFSSKRAAEEHESGPRLTTSDVDTVLAVTLGDELARIAS